MIYSSRRLCQYTIFSLLAAQLVYQSYRKISHEQSYPKLTGVYCATGKLDADSLDRHPIDDSLNIRQCSLTNIDACQRISSRTLLFQMHNSAGFASEINNLLRAFLYAIETRRKFLIDDQNWNYGPFSSLFNTSQGHFSPWLLSSPECHRRTFVHFIYHLRDNQSIPAHLIIGRESDGGFTTLNTMMEAFEIHPRILQRKRRVARYLWHTINYHTRSFLQKSLDEIQMQTIHYAVHIRRGDKLQEEAKYIGIESYLESVEHLMKQLGESDLKPRVFVASDEFNTIEQLRQKRPEWNFVQLPSLHSSIHLLSHGHVQINFNQLSTEQKLESTLLLMADIEILARVNHLVCTFSSNICRLVHILKRQSPGTVVSLDEEWYPQ